MNCRKEERMKKGFKTAVIAAALVLTLAACGSKGASTDRSYYLDGGSSYEDAGVSASKGLNYAPDHAMEVTASDSQAQYYSKDGSLTTTSSQMRENTKIIYTAYMQLQSTEFDETVETLEQMVFSIGGYFEKQNLNNGSYYSSKSVRLRNASFTVRVPSESFADAMAQAGDFGKIINRNVNSQDVSDNYYDLKSRLETKYILRDKLTGYLSQAKDIKDLLEIERQLNSVLEDIDSTEGRFKRLSGQIDYSTIYINMQFEAGKNESGIILPDVKDSWNKFITTVIAFFWGLLKVLFYIVIFGIPLIALAAFFFWLLFGKVGLLVRLFKKLKK